MKVGDISIAILHDRFPRLGGGEQFAIEAARVLDAPVYTMYVSPSVREKIPDDIDVRTIKQSKYTGVISGRLLKWSSEGMNPLESLNVALDMASADLDQYDVVFESSPLCKSYVPSPQQSIIHYPHSPPRWLYDLYTDRLEKFNFPILALLVKIYAKSWRSLDKESNDYVDRFVANSEVVKQRINRYYRRDADVIYPPVTGDWRNNGDEGYFVTWSRLVPEKRIGMIAEAFAGTDEKLVIAGDGEQRSSIESISSQNDNIEYKGYVDDIESLVATASAVVYAPKQEDFGIVGAEAMIAGKPLLGVNEGFTKEQVIEEKTGVLFEPTVKSLQETVQSFSPEDFTTTQIQRESDRFGYDSFRQQLREVVVEVHEES